MNIPARDQRLATAWAEKNAASLDLWIVNSDGGCRSNPGPAGFGVVVQHPVSGTIENSGFIGRATNQVAELRAAIEGLRLTPAGAGVVLKSDSQYTLKGISQWRAGWVRDGFRNAAGKRVANLEIWHELWAEVDRRRVRTLWVKGHNGDPMNERCDRLANEAIDRALRTATTPDSVAGVHQAHKDAVANVLSYTWSGESALTAERVARIQGDRERPGCTLTEKQAAALLDELVAEGRVLREGDRYRLVAPKASSRGKRSPTL